MSTAEGIPSAYHRGHRDVTDQSSQLRCDVVTEPALKPCSRCIKHNLHCAIDPGFRRQEKRQQYVELEKELLALRAENAELRGGRPQGLLTGAGARSVSFAEDPDHNAALHGPSEQAASRSLLDLAQSGHDTSHGGGANSPSQNTLARITLSNDQISELFAIFFSRYHPYLPLLSPELSPSAYFNMSPLLYWTIITVASRRYDPRPGLLTDLKRPLTDFLWETIGSIPQNYHVVKALCFLCTWPLPTSSTSLDPSTILCGTMVSIAMQFGLHRPSHAQDFSRSKIELAEEDIKDRMNTWVVVNIVAQTISTGYGMPQLARWNWYTHGLHTERISTALRTQCAIQRFIDKVTRTLYTMQRDLVIKSDEATRAFTIDTFQREYDELETTTRAQNPTSQYYQYL